MLFVLVTARGSRRPAPIPGASFALFAYAAAFSFAYVRITAGTGALLLFGSVQATMIGAGVVHGERPRLGEWVGLAVASAGLMLLAAPGAEAPDPLGAALMVVAGVAWGAYSLRGRGSTEPLGSTAVHFLRAVPLAVVLLAGAAVLRPVHVTSSGLALATASGAVASGIGYSLWYAALPSLTATRASLVQLSVPALAALGGVALLGETLTIRLLVSAAALLGGIALAVATRPGRR